jgi:hypothetical protein
MAIKPNQAQAAVGHPQHPNGLLATTVTFAQSVVADETWPMGSGNGFSPLPVTEIEGLE